MSQVSSNESPVGRDTLSAVIRVSWLLEAVWSARRFILASTLVALFLGILIVRFMGASYVATEVLMPADSDTARIGALGAVTSLMSDGADMPVSRFKAFQVALTSAAVAERLEKKGVLCKISVQCDQATNTWQAPHGISLVTSSLANFLLGKPPRTTTKPTPTEFAEFVRAHVVLQPQRNGTLQLSYSGKNPELTAWFLQELVATSNDYIKEGDRASYQRYVDYLMSKLNTLTVVTQRDSLQVLLTEQSRRLMLTQVGVPYAARTLDAPAAKRMSVTPTIVFFGVAGLAGSSILIIILSVLPGRFAGWMRLLVPRLRSTAEKTTAVAGVESTAGSYRT